MKKYLKQCSSKTMITIFVLVFIVPLIILLIATSAFALNSYQTQTTQTMEQMASYFLSETDTSLSDIDHYLAKTASENYAFGRIAYEDSTAYQRTEYELFRTRFYLSMQQTIDFYPNAQYLFFYQKNRDDLLLISSSSYSALETSLDYTTMSSYLADYLQEKPAAQKEWKLTTINGQKQLLRLFQFGNSYLGASVPITTMLDKLEKYNLDNCSFHISSSEFDKNDMITPMSLFKDSSILLNSNEGNYAISLTINRQEFSTPALIVYSSILLISILLLSLIPFSHRVLKNQFYIPLQVLEEHMIKIEAGNTQERLPAQLGGPETSHLSQTFNQMMEQIDNLKIQVYEEKLAQSKLEIQCLHLQLNPHFFLNTLNSAFLLIKTGELEKLQSLLKSLTEYFRSIFQCSSESTLLSLEVEQCRNYIYIYQIRCFKKIQVNFDVKKHLTNWHVPPMCILTFIENSIKYAVEDLDNLSIIVSAREIEFDNKPYIEINILDNGTGFSSDILTELNQEFVTQPLTGAHIGIRNLQHRLYYIYKGAASITFTNADLGGAQITLRIPFLESDSDRRINS